MQKAKLLALMLLSLFLIGCIGDAELSESRLLCLDLTSPASTGIPFCSTQDSCFKEVEAHFAFDTTPFSQVVQEKIFEFKNRLARSWLYYNLAVVNLNYLHAACYKSDFTSIRQQVNELSHNAVAAFDEADKAHQIAFAILLLEKSDLENSDINMVKEEELFNDYSLISENVVALNNEQLRNGGSFASAYFRNAEKFLSFAEKFSFSGERIGEFTVFDFVDKFDEKILKNIPTKPFYLPILSSVLGDLISKTNDIASIYAAKSILQASPSYELLETYRALAAPTSSTTSMFIGMMQSDSLHRKELSERTELLEENMANEFNAVSVKISGIDSEYYSVFDQNFLGELASLLGRNSRISNEIFEFTDFSTLKADSDERLTALMSEFYLMKNSEYLGGISIGMKVHSLKSLILQTRQLSENISYFSESSFENFGTVCDEKVSSIKKSIPEVSFSQVASLKSIIIYHISEYEKAETPKTKLPLCRNILEAYDSMLLAVEDVEEFELSQESSLKSCIKSLESLFSSAPDLFPDILPLFEKLKISQLSDDTILLQKCSSIKEKALLSWHSSEQVSRIEGNHSKAKIALARLEALQRYVPDVKPETADFADAISKQSGFFSGDALDPFRSINNMDELQASSEKLLDSMVEFFEENFAFYLKETSAIKLESEGIPEANFPSISKLKVIFNNAIYDYNKQVSIRLEKTQETGSLSYLSGNISSAQTGKDGITVNFNYVPMGPSIAVFDINGIAAKTKETMPSVAFEGSSAIVEKKISLESNNVIPIVKISSKSISGKLLNLKESKAYTSAKPVDLYNAPDSVYFFAENAENNSTYFLILHFDNAVEITTIGSESISLDQNELEYTFDFEVKNNLPIDAENAKFIMGLPFTEKNYSSIAFFDSSGRQLQSEKISERKFSVSMPSIRALSKITVHLKAKTKNYSGFWGEAISLTEEKLNGLILSENNEVSSNAKKLLAQLSDLKKNGNFSDSSSMREFIDLSTKTNTLTEITDSDNRLAGEFFALKSSAEQEIKKQKELAENLRNLGFSEKAEKIEKEMQGSERLLKEAQSLFLKDKGAAIEKILLVKSGLSDIPYLNSSQIIIDEKNRILDSFRSLQSISEKAGIDIGESGFFELAQEIEDLHSNNNLAEAGKKLNELSRISSDLNISFSAKVSEKVAEAKSLINSYETLAGNVSDKADLLEKFLGDFNSSETYLPPTTLERIDKLRRLASGLETPEMKSALKSFRSTETKDPLQALVLFNEMLPDIENAKLKLGKIGSELTSDLKEIELDSLSFYNKAVAKANSVQIGADARERLEKAKEEFDEGNYPGSLTNSLKAIGLMSLSNASGFEIPLSIYPLAAVIGIVLYFRHKKKNTPQQISLKVERISP